MLTSAVIVLITSAFCCINGSGVAIGSGQGIALLEPIKTKETTRGNIDCAISTTATLFFVHSYEKKKNTAEENERKKKTRLWKRSQLGGGAIHPLMCVCLVCFLLTYFQPGLPPPPPGSQLNMCEHKAGAGYYIPYMRWSFRGDCISTASSAAKQLVAQGKRRSNK